jgi:hypothetical protein
MLGIIKTIWKNKALIWEGFLNSLIKKEPVEKIHNKRMKICSTCPELDPQGSKCVITGTQPCCGVCGCSLAMKLRSMDSECPHPDGPKWKAVEL